MTGNPVLVNLVTLAIIILGSVSVALLPQDINPEVKFNWVFVTAIYPGAGPREVERLVTVPIEDAVAGIDHLEKISSVSGEGVLWMNLEFEEIDEIEMQTALSDIRAELAKLEFPDGMEDPVAEEFSSSDFQPLVQVVLTSDRPQAELRRLAEKIERGLADVRDVSKVQVGGVTEREIWVSCQPELLQSFGVSVLQVMRALQAAQADLPAGQVDQGRDRRQLLRVVSQLDSVQDLGQVVVRAQSGKGALRVGDVAQILDTQAEEQVRSRYDGAAAVTFSISKSASGAAIGVVDDVRDKVASLQAGLPPGSSLHITGDTSSPIRDVLRLLLRNAAFGMAVIAGLMLYFLGFRSAFLASLGIPFAFLITFIALRPLGLTINGSTLFALVMALGIVVDDAVILLENADRHRRSGLPLREAVLEGTRQVMWPITAAILTSIAAFLPLMLMPGIMGQFMRVVPLCVSIALLASLGEALLILPSHIIEWTAGSKAHERPERRPMVLLRQIYARTLPGLLRFRWLLLVAGGLVLLVGAAAAPLLGAQLFAGEEMTLLYVQLRMPPGTRLDATDRALSAYERLALSLPEDELVGVTANPGFFAGANKWETTPEVGQVTIELVPKRQRSRSGAEVLQWLRDNAPPVPGVHEVAFDMEVDGPPMGKPIAARLQGEDLEQLLEAAAHLKGSLAGVEGVQDIGDDTPPGAAEYRVLVDRQRAAELGISPQDVALSMRAAVHGSTAIQLREHDEAIDVVVKLRDGAAQTAEQLRALRFGAADGQLVPFSEVAELQSHSSMSSIHRYQRERSIIVSARFDEQVTDLSRVNQRLGGLLSELEQRYAGLNAEVGGEWEEFGSAFEDILSLFALGMCLIYLILGAQFRSYLQPLLIISAVPFSFLGAEIGLLISGNPFSIVAMYGMVALAGVAVNDGIILVSFTNELRAGGKGIMEAVVEAGRLRLRPIAMTTITTVGALAPMAIGLGGRSATWSPMANVLVFGLLLAMVQTLVVIPCLYVALEDVKGLPGRLRRAGPAAS